MLIRVRLRPSKREDNMLVGIEVWSAEKTDPFSSPLRGEVLWSRSGDDRTMRQVSLGEADSHASQFSGVTMMPAGWL